MRQDPNSPVSTMSTGKTGSRSSVLHCETSVRVGFVNAGREDRSYFPQQRFWTVYLVPGAKAKHFWLKGLFSPAIGKRLATKEELFPRSSFGRVTGSSCEVFSTGIEFSPLSLASGPAPQGRG